MQFVNTSPTNLIAEAELVREARRGNEQAFLLIYRQHRAAVFQFAWRLTGSQATAEDITQECFLALVRGGKFDGQRGMLRTYLFGIARNLMLRSLRTSAQEVEQPLDIMAPVDVLNDLLSAERSELLAEAMARLPVLQREALILFVFDEMPLEEIAEVTGSEIGAVKSRLHRGRESLRRTLTPLLTTNPERKCS